MNGANWVAALLCFILLLTFAACSQEPESLPEPPASNSAPSPASPAPEPPQAPDEATQPVAPEGDAPPSAQAPTKSAPPAVPSAPAKEPPPAKEQANAAPAHTQPPPSAADSKHEAVGSAKCKMCHKVQYASWAASKHATVEPKAECETCHGNGKDYISMSVMKNRAQAVAAGLILPGKELCTAKCHEPAAFKAEMLQAVHAHKAK